MSIAERIPQADPALKQQLKETWCAGDYGQVARVLAASTAQLLERYPVRPGADILDVACGNGQIALAAARAGARATGIDIADNLIEQGRRRAREESLAVRLDVGDAESLPYADNSFDQVYSIIGAMFAPRPEQAAAELLRVCRPGGQIIMVNWTPDGFIGQFFKTVARHMPPPDGMPSPLLWGQEPHVRERFGKGVAKLKADKQFFEFHFPYPPADVVDFFGTYFGPVQRALAALGESAGQALKADLVALWEAHNLADDGTTYTRGEALEIVIVPA
ncbi:MAG: class I SAM-dependent methyltransferase [Pseudomonadota bacterium]|nr:class I SAM-dependent methyltransferase [Pseudomonadota bacterium]